MKDQEQKLYEILDREILDRDFGTDRKLKDILLERYMQIHGREITVEKIRKAEPEWTRICKSIGISRSTRGVLPQKPPAGTVFVKDPEPLSSFKEGMLVMQHDTMEKILALGFLP